MSSQAVGCMTVVLPESKIPEFEAYFDEENEFAFKNTEIWLREVADARIVGFQRRIYDILSENKKMPRKTDKYWGLMYPEKLINTEN